MPKQSKTTNTESADFKRPYKVIFRPVSGMWFAICKELDVLGSGATKEDAKRAVLSAIRMECLARAKQAVNSPDSLVEFEEE